MKYFGTDGLRGKAEKFNPDFLAALVRGIIDYTGDNKKVLIGGDTRESTEWILSDLEAALETFGIEYGNVGVLSTPAINYCFPKMGFDIAIDVTASHNPYTDNGIKIFERINDEGQKLCEKGCLVIERALAEKKAYNIVPSSIHESIHQDALDVYKVHLKNSLGEVNFSNLRIGMDCANGATSALNKIVFEEFGAEVELINANEKYNTEINKDCGSTHLEQIQNLVRSLGLDFGVAFDGDGDRCLLVDDNGEIVDGDQIIAILANYLGLKSIAVSVMANQGLINWAKDNNITLEITPVGDSNVAAAMREKNIDLGGEQSGHIILPGEATGDGMLTALLVAKIVAETGKKLSQLAEIINKLPQVMINISATPDQKQALKEKTEIKTLLLDYGKKLEVDNGRLLVRPSGTEDLIRITMWGEDDKKINNLAEELKNKLEELL